MKIQKIVSQMRRDFTAIYECEHCKSTEEGKGYDDEYFHRKVIPGMICKNCGEKSPSDYRGLMPKYPDGIQL